MTSDFRTTRWNIVELAAKGEDDAIDELVETYWKPIYFHLRRSGHADADAQDLTQAFLSKFCLKGGFRTAEKRKGRFRTFLLTSLRRFVINEWKKESAQKRGGTALHLSLDFDAVAESRDDYEAKDLTPDQAFDRQWGLAVLRAAFARLKAEQTNEGNEERFVQLTALLACEDEAPSYRELAERLGDSPGCPAHESCSLAVASSRVDSRGNRKNSGEPN